MEWMPVASRSRKQRELREKELREKNKRARLAARNEYWKKNAAKMSNPRLGGDDEEDVIVADESEYLKRTSKVGGKESCQNVDMSFEESSDDSVQIVGERWNPLGAGFDNNEDGEDFDGVATDFQPGPSKASSKGCRDNQSLSMDVVSEDSGAASDGRCSSPLESSENDDDEASDEDFLVDEAEMHTAYSSESSEYYSAYASEKEGKWKGKTCAKKINKRFLDEDIQSSDEFDENYLPSLKRHYGGNSRQIDNAGKRKRGRPKKNRSSGFEYEAEDVAMSENSDCSKNGSFIQSSPLPYQNSKSGATKKRGRPRKNTCEIIRSESESENDLIGVFAKSEKGGGNRKKGRLPHFEEISDADENYLEWLRSLEFPSRCGNAGNRKRGRPRKGMNVGVDFESENELKPMNGGYRKRGRPPKKNIIETESESENDLVGTFGKFENGRNGERGKVGADFEPVNEMNGGYRKRGRPPKKNIIETESESENDLVGTFGNFENGGSRERGKLPHFEDTQDGDELYLRWLRSLELSSRCEKGGSRPPKGRNVGVGSEPENDSHQQRVRLPKNGGHGKRGRPRKSLNEGFDSERGCKRARGRPPKNLNKGLDSIYEYPLF